MSFKFHGNYCGPGWNQGKWQTSKKRKIGAVEPIDELDAICAEHDDAYANGRDLKQADYRFFKKAKKLGLQGKLAAVGVGVQGLMRIPTENPINSEFPSKSSFPQKEAVSNMPKSVKKYSSKKKSSSARRRNTKSNKSSKSKRYSKKKMGSRKKSKRTNKSIKNPMDLLGCKNGSVSKFEQCGTESAVAAGDTIFIGHAIARQRIGESVCRSLVKLLLNANGYYFNNWDEPLTGVGLNYSCVWFTYYKLDTDRVATLVQSNIGTGSTSRDIAIGLYTAMLTLADTEIFIWQDIGLTYTSSGIPGVYVPMAHFNLNSISLQIEFASRLKLQNRTPGDGPTSDPNITDDTFIAENPLEGQYYLGKQSLNGFCENARPTITAGAEDNSHRGLLANYVTGLINTTVAGNPGLHFINPPVAWSIGATSVPCLVQPSKHLISLLTYKRKCTFQYFSQRWFQSIQAPSATKVSPFRMGPAALYALEKVIATADLVTNGKPKVGIELEQSYGCVAHVKNNLKTIPINHE